MDEQTHLTQREVHTRASAMADQIKDLPSCCAINIAMTFAMLCLFRHTNESGESLIESASEFSSMVQISALASTMVPKGTTKQ